MPTMTGVISSNIAEIGYDDLEETLYVTFLSGATWRYFNVPYTTYLELLEAPSVGSFFCRRIKGVYNAKPSPSQA